MNCARLKRTVSWAIIFIILSWHFFPSVVCAEGGQIAQEVSFVIWPQADGTNDDVSNDAAAAVREALPLVMPAHIVSPQIVEKVLSYYQKEGKASGTEATAVDNLSSAKEHYFNFHYDEALVEVGRAVEILSAGSVSENGSLLQDALITQGVIARSAGKADIAKTAFDRAVRLNPFYRIDYRAFPPSIVEIFEQSRSALMQGEKGALRVETDPYTAEVFINGVMQGVTPIDLAQVPAGSYTLLIKTNKYQPVERQIKITAGEKLVVNEKLKWEGDRPRAQKKLKEDSRAEIDEGIRIADLLKVDKAIIIDSDDSQVISVRMVDRKYRAAHRQIVVRYDATGKAQAIADLTETLANLARINLLNNPMKYLDPDGIGDPILLTGRKREYYKKPIFWGAIGTAAAGAIVGGILAAMSGGSDDRTGSVAVQFK